MNLLYCCENVNMPIMEAHSRKTLIIGVILVAKCSCKSTVIVKLISVIKHQVMRGVNCCILCMRCILKSDSLFSGTETGGSDGLMDGGSHVRWHKQGRELWASTKVHKCKTLWFSIMFKKYQNSWLLGLCPHHRPHGETYNTPPGSLAAGRGMTATTPKPYSLSPLDFKLQLFESYLQLNHQNLAMPLSVLY